MPRAKDWIEAARHPDFVSYFLAYKCGCLIFVLLLTMPLTILLTILINLMSVYPSCSLQTLYVPALNKYLNSSTAAADSLIFFDLHLENPYKLSFHYDDVKLTFYSKVNESMAIGNYTVPGFNQGQEKKTWRRDVVLATGSVRWQEAAITALSNGEKAGFRVDAAGKVKFKYVFWYSNKKKLLVGGNVEVDDSGRNVGKKAVKLVKSGAPPPLRAGLLVVTCLVVYLV